MDSSGNAWIGGDTSESIDGETGGGGHDIYLIKYDTDGVRQWTVMHGGTATDELRGLQAGRNLVDI